METIRILVTEEHVDVEKQPHVYGEVDVEKRPVTEQKPFIETVRKADLTTGLDLTPWPPSRRGNGELRGDLQWSAPPGRRRGPRA